MILKKALEKLEDKCYAVDVAVDEVGVAEYEVGQAIRKTREANKISLRKFAIEVGISAAYLSDIENGNRYPAPNTLEKIIASLSRSPSSKSK